MKEHQTPRNRRTKESPSSKSISDQSKKQQQQQQQKIAKKNLNAEFSSVSEDVLTESLTESFSFSPVSEVVLNETPHNGESLESLECLFAGENYSLSTLEESPTPSDSTPLKITTVSDESIGSNGSPEAETGVVSNLLKQARVQVQSSSDIHPGFKKLLDALVEVSVKEFYALPVERDRIDVLISERVCVLLVCFLVWLMISVIVIVSSRGSGTRGSYSFYPPPT